LTSQAKRTGELLGIELGDRGGAGRTGQQRAPARLDVRPDRSHQAEAGDDDPTHRYFPIFSWR
jgi:hypothetical protein